MDESGEDRISKLPDSVVCHILSRLHTKDAVRTSVLSKDWEHKWTSIYDIEIDERISYFLGENKIKSFVSFMNTTLRLTQKSRIKSFRLLCDRELGSHLKRWTADVLMRGVQILEIYALSHGVTFASDLYNCKSLIELTLYLECTLTTSFMKNCFHSLKILYLGREVKLLNDEISDSGKVAFNFPVLEDLELRCCAWQRVSSIEINAPTVTRFVSERPSEGLENDYVIKINAVKLENFQSYVGLLENVVFTAPSVSDALLANRIGGTSLFRAYAILKGFPALERLELSSEIGKVLTKHNTHFPLPNFNRLKQLGFCDNISNEILPKLLPVMPSLESLFLNVYGYDEGLESFPSGIASRLKVVKLVGFGSRRGQIDFAKSVLKSVENLEKLFIGVCLTTLMPKNEIEDLLSTVPKSSTRASVEVTEPRRLSLIYETMDESGEDLISNLPESVVYHILSRLPTKDVMRTSLSSKDWKQKCTLIDNIELDDTNRNKSLSWKTKRKNFVTLVEKTLHSTLNLGIKSFRLTCHKSVSYFHLQTWMRTDLISGVQNLEINVRRCCGPVILNDIFRKCRSVTELKLLFNCRLVIYLVKNRFSNLKILYLGYAVELLHNEVSDSAKLVLNFPVLEDLELRCCKWRRVKSVEINSPALTRFLVEGQHEHFLNDYPIKIDGAKLEKFESCGGLLDNYFVRAPSVSNAVFTNCKGGNPVGFRARAIVRGFPVLECLKLSREIVKAFTQSESDISVLCFNRLKRLEISNHIGNELLLKLLHVMPSLESLSLYVYKDYEELEYFPSGIASSLKVVKLVGYGGTTCQVQLAKSMLNNVENLETLLVSVCYKPVMSKIEIRQLLSTFHRNSTRAEIFVNGPRKRDTILER